MIKPIRKIHQFLIDKPISEGEMLNQRYQVLDMIGAGSYGMVYLCHDLNDQVNKVLKQLRPSKRKSKKEIKLFHDEVSILSNLNHHHMPKLHEVFSDQGHYFYVMDYIDGVNLEDEIFRNKKTFNERESLQFVAQIIKLVEYLHKRNIFHLDLRIPNILVKNNEPYLIDFGLAQQIASSAKLEGQNREEMKLQDYYDLGDILLYLLYTTYSSKTKKALPWTEELFLRKETVLLLEKLLKIDEPYTSIDEILHDLHLAIQAFRE
ncbi:serine/threonine protein kinase [Bacillus nitroreducens]